MPKPTRPKADLADRLCDAIKDLTADRASRTFATQWIAVHEVARHLGITAEQAAALALQRDRIQTDGGSPPHSVSLIDHETGTMHIALLVAVATVRFSRRTKAKALRATFDAEFRRRLAATVDPGEAETRQ